MPQQESFFARLWREMRITFVLALPIVVGQGCRFALISADERSVVGASATQVHFPSRTSFSEFKSNQASPWVARSSHTSSVPCDSASTEKSKKTLVQGESPDS